MYHEESKIQQSCVKWFGLQHAHLDGLLFAVPNGGRRGKTEAAIMKAEGVYPGVADLILLVPRGESHGLCIEMKTPSKTSKQSPSQKEWEKKVTGFGYEYFVCRSLEEFIQIIENYLKK